MFINNYKAHALIDTGSSERSFVDSGLVKKFGLTLIPERGVVSLASGDKSCSIDGFVLVELKLFGNIYADAKLYVSRPIYR